jgi:hypothetical protein
MKKQGIAILYCIGIIFVAILFGASHTDRSITAKVFAQEEAAPGPTPSPEEFRPTPVKVTLFIFPSGSAPAVIKPSAVQPMPNSNCIAYLTTGVRGIYCGTYHLTASSGGLDTKN